MKFVDDDDDDDAVIVPLKAGDLSDDDN